MSETIALSGNNCAECMNPAEGPFAVAVGLLCYILTIILFLNRQSEFCD